MAFIPRNDREDRGGERGGGERGPRRAGPGGEGRRGPRSKSSAFRKKQNRFNMVFIPGQLTVDFKDTDKLTRFLTEKGKIIPRRITGLTAKQQRMLARAIKKARHAGLVAFQTE